MSDKPMTVPVDADQYESLKLLAKDADMPVRDLVRSAINNLFCYAPVHDTFMRLEEEEGEYHVG